MLDILGLVAILESRDVSAHFDCFEAVALGRVWYSREEISDTTNPSHFVGVVVDQNITIIHLVVTV